MNTLILSCVVMLLFRYEIVNGGIVNNEQRENPANDEQCMSTCSSKDCADIAKSLNKNMDENIKRCDNFYEFVCGNYIKTNVIPEDKVSISQFSTAQDKLNENLIKAVNSEVLPTDSKAIKKLKVHYKNCLDEAEIEKVGAIPLLDLIKRVGGWPVLLGDEWKEEDFKWEDVMSNISKEGFSPDFPVSLFTGLDSTDSHKFSLKVFPAGTSIDDAVDHKFLEAYKTYLVEIAVLLSADREKANGEMKDLVDFDQKLFKAQLARDQLRDVSRIENRITISEMNKKYPDLAWLDIINRILKPSNMTVNESEFVEVFDPKFMSEIGSLINSTPKRVLANYQVFQLIEGLISFLPEKFRNQKLKFDQTAYGIKKYPKREKFCLSLVRGSFYIAISSLYVKNYFGKETKYKVSEIIDNIREETKVSLEKLDWMDDYTREGALKKLESMKALAAYPDELFDDRKINRYYRRIKITEGKLFDDILKISANAKDSIFKRLRKPTRRYEWISNAGVAVVNAFYSPGKNQISIIAGILQEPFFKSEWPDYLNYGGIGVVIGHEITHGFDNNGRKYDFEGNVNDWWNNKTAKDFEHKVQCKVDQYSNYTINQIDKKINGKLTRGENIADAGGIKLAYHAYEKLIKSRGAMEECLPDIKYTPKQMFWISAATTWCRKITDEYFKHLIVLDPHSPAEARVNIVFSGNQDFAKDFNCPAGSKMNSIEKCEVW